HAAGDEHRPRRVAYYYSRQLNQGCARSSRDDGPDDGDETLRSRDAAADRLSSKPGDPGGAPHRRHPSHHFDRRDYRHGGRYDRDAGNLPIRADGRRRHRQGHRTFPYYRHSPTFRRTAQAVRHATTDFLLRGARKMLISTIIFLFFLFLTYALFLLASRKSDARQERLQQRVAEALQDSSGSANEVVEIAREDSIGGNPTVNRLLS